jgi:KipI family sensor histidine kinase inhibitor
MMEISPAGDRAVLVTFDEVSAAELHARAAAVREVADVVDCVPGHSSLLVICDAEPDMQSIANALSRSLSGAPPPPAAFHRITVSFAGPHAPDLREFLAIAGLTRDDFLAQLRDVRLMARFLGFRAGFAYLDGWPDAWAMPRRPTSRPLVSRGSFAIAGSTAGFYPLDSPGGWNLLGRAVELPRIAAGDEVTIEPTLEASGFSVAAAGPAAVGRPEAGPQTEANPDFEILAAPLAITVRANDAFDDIAARLANRAAGNADDALLFECAFVWPRLRFLRKRVVALYSAGESRQVVVEAGEELAPGRISGGLRGYLAIGDGGVLTPLARGDRHVIRVRRGPHHAPLPDAIECEVTPRIDRVGLRLRPLQPLGFTPPADLRSCGMLTGTIQLHPDGTLVAMGPDHPITGGYLQPMTVLSSERWKLAYLMPGETLSFRA